MQILDQALPPNAMPDALGPGVRMQVSMLLLAHNALIAPRPEIKEK